VLGFGQLFLGAFELLEKVIEIICKIRVESNTNFTNLVEMGIITFL